jgi:hypothetical protein
MQMLFGLVCHEVIENEHGSLDIIGAFDVLSAEQLPIRMKSLAVVLKFVAEPSDGPHHLVHIQPLNLDRLPLGTGFDIQMELTPLPASRGFAGLRHFFYSQPGFPSGDLRHRGFQSGDLIGMR